MSLDGVSVLAEGRAARRVKVLTLDAQVLVRLLVAMSSREQVYRIEGMPADARVVGTQVGSPWERRDHEVKLVIASETFEDVSQEARLPELDLAVSQYVLPFGQTLGAFAPDARRAIRLRTEEPLDWCGDGEADE